MIKKSLIGTACVLLLAACDGKSGFTIRGTVSTPELNDQYVYLQPYDTRQTSPVDSTLVKNGTFSFKGSQDIPALYVIHFAPDIVKPMRNSPGKNAPYSAVFPLENGTISVVLDEQPSISGTPMNDEIKAFQQKLSDLQAGRKQLIDESRSQDEKVVSDAEEKLDEMDIKVTKAIMEFFNANIHNPIAPKYFSEFRYDLNDDQKNAILSQADSAFKTTPGVDNIVNNMKIRNNTAAGKKFLDFEMADVNGKMHKLSEYVGNGKVVLIDFWASWCPPCRKEMPHLVELYKEYKDKGFEIVGVSLDSTTEDWKSGIKNLGITWPQLSDLKKWDNEGSDLYGVSSIPETILVSTDGTVIAKKLSTKDLKKKLEELLGK